VGVGHGAPVRKSDVATIGILQQRTIDHANVLTEQLQTALNSRVIIEQAKGMLAAYNGILTPAEAFTALRGYAAPTTTDSPTSPGRSSMAPPTSTRSSHPALPDAMVTAGHRDNADRP
jgi:hypothetical protein